MKKSTNQHKTLRFLLILILVTTFWGTLPATPARAAVITVMNSNESGAGSLQQAITDANPGDVIVFHQDLAGQTITLTSSTLGITKSLVIDGADLDPHIQISGNNTNQIFNIAGSIDVSLGHLDLIDGSNNPGGAIFNNSTSLSIENCLFSGNYSGNDGGAIYHIGGTLTISDSTFDGNNANNNGGAIFAGDPLSITRSTFVNNWATNDGGAIALSNTATITNSTFYNNHAARGGGIFNGGTLTLNNNTLSDNYANASNGGGIYNNSTLHLKNTIIANSATGGDCAQGLPNIPTNTNNLIEDNTCSPDLSGDPVLLAIANNGGQTETMALGPGSPAIDGIPALDASWMSYDQRGVKRPHGASPDIGAYEAASGLRVNSNADPGDGVCDDTECTLREAIQVAGSGDTVNFDPLTMSGNTVTLSTSSTIDINKDLTIYGSALDDNLTLSGDSTYQILRINKGADVIVRNLDFVDGTAYAGGAVEILNNSEFTCYNCKFDTNIVTNTGGAIHNNYSRLNLYDSYFSNNSAGDYGGAIHSLDGTNYLLNNTFEENQADDQGGAIRNLEGSFTIINSTFYLNNSDMGGGIFNWEGTLTINNSTLAANYAISGGGGVLSSGTGSTLHLTNTIIANSASGGDCAGTLSTNLNNLIEDGSCGTSPSGDPGLGALTYNGGFTKTMVPGFGSPAIDAGNDGQCHADDQRGVNRPHGAHCDIGAFETADGLQVNSVNEPGDGICDSSECTLREAIAVADKGRTVTFNPALSGSQIPLNNTLLIDKDLTLDASMLGNNVKVSGDYSVRVFDLAENITASFSHLDIIRGDADIGAGILIPGSTTVNINDCYFDINDADTGGAINNAGNLTITDSTFSENAASDHGLAGSNYGGAINNNGGTVTISGSSFDNNSSITYGGGIFNNIGTMTITNSTISGNTASDYGGGISNWMGSLTLNNCTIANNTASVGAAGISNGHSSAVLHISNTIIADSNDTEDCLNGGTIATNQNNLIEDGTCSPALTGDPGLGYLSDNGGLTHTMDITESSPAFNAGDDASCESVDQRGISRPQGSHCDIGAFELEVYYPEIDIQGNNQSIADGDSTPSSADYTDFGTAFLGLSPVTRSFTVQNTGAEVLNLTDSPAVQITGTHLSDFTVTSQPTSPIPSSGGSTTFTISFTPSAIGLREATITIANDDQDENPYTFSIQGAGSDGTFSDVTSAHWAFQYVEAIADAGLTSGYPDGTYRPENPVTRAEMAVFLLNGMGVSAPAIDGSHPFSDIAGHWAESYIEELYDQGITGGYPDGTYRPENLVTRAEMAVFLLKGIGVTPPALDGSHPFSDVAGHWAEIFIEELYDQGITGGYPDGTYRPENRVTRAEMAVFLVNTFGIPLP